MFLIPRPWDQCKTTILMVARAYDPKFHGEAHWRDLGMLDMTMAVLEDLMTIDTEEEDREDQMAEITPAVAPAAVLRTSRDSGAWWYHGTPCWTNTLFCYLFF